MKIITISDTHGFHKLIPKSWLRKADTIIHSGDITSAGYIEEIKNFLVWFDKLGYDNKIFIAGNHDWGFESYPEKTKELLENYPSITYLQDSEVVIDGIKIYGSPQTPYFRNWAFNCARNEQDGLTYSKELISTYWDKIPLDTNVLVTHGPPHGIGDFVPYNGRGNVGCESLLAKAYNLEKLKLHVCGHVHCGYGENFIQHVNYINAATCNERYEIVNEPILIEI